MVPQAAGPWPGSQSCHGLAACALRASSSSLCSARNSESKKSKPTAVLDNYGSRCCTSAGSSPRTDGDSLWGLTVGSWLTGSTHQTIKQTLTSDT